MIKKSIVSVEKSINLYIHQSDLSQYLTYIWLCNSSSECSTRSFPISDLTKFRKSTRSSVSNIWRDIDAQRMTCPQTKDLENRNEYLCVSVRKLWSRSSFIPSFQYWENNSFDPKRDVNLSARLGFGFFSSDICSSTNSSSFWIDVSTKRRLSRDPFVTGPYLEVSFIVSSRSMSTARAMQSSVLSTCLCLVSATIPRIVSSLSRFALNIDFKVRSECHNPRSFSHHSHHSLFDDPSRTSTFWQNMYRFPMLLFHSSWSQRDALSIRSSLPWENIICTSSSLDILTVTLEDLISLKCPAPAGISISSGTTVRVLLFEIRWSATTVRKQIWTLSVVSTCRNFNCWELYVMDFNLDVMTQ